MDQHGDRGDRYGDYPATHPNSHSVTSSSWSSNNSVSHHDGNWDNHSGGFPNNGSQLHHRRPHHLYANHQQHHNFSSEPNGTAGRCGESVSSSNPPPLSGHKRQFPHSVRGPPPDYNDGTCVKLYVRGVPRTVTEQDIQSFFGQYGSIVEVVLLKDKKSGLQQECCFVKYAAVMEAERAIGALHNKQTFPGGMVPIEVKYAVGEQERLAGFGRQECKLYVGGLNKQASNVEIAEIFSPYGCVLEVFQLRDEQRQNRGLAFIQFTERDMAVTAMAKLNGKYVMKGCDMPLVVRFADPKKPKTGEPRPGPYFRDSVGQPMLHNASHVHSQTGRGTPSTFSNSPAVPSFSEMADLPDCDWSEHICPDGNDYYYNCVTCESRWDKPAEYRLFEQQIQNGQQRHPPTQHLHSHSDPQVLSTHHAPQIQQVQLQT